MPTFNEAPQSVYSAMRFVIAERFPETLKKYEVTVGLLMARSSREGQPALKIRGYPVDAKVKVIGLEDRTAGQPDARIVIDAEAWDAMDAIEQEALLAHELYHLELVRDEDEDVKIDDHGRPCLRNRPHDVEAGLFREVFDWYGVASGEWRMRRAVARLFEQGLLPFDKAAATAAATAEAEEKLDVDAELAAGCREVEESRGKGETAVEEAKPKQRRRKARAAS